MQALSQLSYTPLLRVATNDNILHLIGIEPAIIARKSGALQTRQRDFSTAQLEHCV
jgi:hypothetical protein